jgi:class 3 adenylate cyclase
MRAIVFTDMNGSVAQVQKHGDHGHLELLETHDTIVREVLGTHRGREVKHTGDGVMAAFNSVSSAVEFAIAVQRQLREHNTTAATPFSISVGINAGEPVTRGSDDLFGAAVQIAARLCGFAQSGEILVSSVVRELCAGKKLPFEDRGEVTLKGLPEPARVFSVNWA